MASIMDMSINSEEDVYQSDDVASDHPCHLLNDGPWSLASQRRRRVQRRDLMKLSGVTTRENVSGQHR